RLPPRSTPSLFPYTTLFRSHARSRTGHGHRGAENLTLTQALLMEAVRGLDSPNVGAVAHVVGVSSPSATRMIQQLERKGMLARQDRKSTRLNSSHVSISYAV